MKVSIATPLLHNNISELMRFMMSVNAVVRARISEHVKREASAVLSAIGLSVSDVVRMLLTRIATEKHLPFEPMIPNTQSISSIKEANKNKT